MSTFEVPLVSFVLDDHPNADFLSIAKLSNGLQCVVKTEDFKNDSLAVYLPIDSVTKPDHPLLSFLNGERVKSKKLKGVISNGLILPYSTVKEYLTTQKKFSDESLKKVSVIGKDFSGILGIKRWMDPTVRYITGDEVPRNPELHKYTDIEHLHKFKEVIVEEEVVVTEKLHGASAIFGFVNDEIIISSRNRQLKVPEEDTKKLSIWQLVYLDIKDSLFKLKSIYSCQKIFVYGEIVGKGVQDLDYGFNKLTFYVYDIKVNERFLNFMEMDILCDKVDLNKVPVLSSGFYNEKMLDLKNGSSTICDKHCREGIVIKTIIEKYDDKLGRCILKVIGDDYLLRSNQIDIRE